MVIKKVIPVAILLQETVPSSRSSNNGPGYGVNNCFHVAMVTICVYNKYTQNGFTCGITALCNKSYSSVQLLLNNKVCGVYLSTTRPIFASLFCQTKDNYSYNYRGAKDGYSIRQFCRRFLKLSPQEEEIQRN